MNKSKLRKTEICKVPLFPRMRRIYFKIFRHYRRLEFRAASYSDADKLIRGNVGKPESEQWILAKEEDTNPFFSLVVFLERRERILK